MCQRASGRSTIRLARPSLGPAEEEACLRVLRSGRLVQGAEGEAFEAEFAQRVGAAHAIAVSSGTAALQLALMALTIGAGDEVVVPAYTFIATANAVTSTGAQVVLADVEDETLNMDPRSLDQVMQAGERIRAVLPVHQYGLPADVSALAAVAREAYLVEDAACAAGAELGDEPVGRPRGLLACFSFHPRKVLTTGEGGLITTSDAGLACRLRALRQHGLSGEAPVEPGYNFRMSELAAAIGRAQLARLDAMLATRRRLAMRYFDGLAGLDCLQLPPRAGHIFQSFVVRLRPDSPLEREALMAELAREGIETQAGVEPIHFHAPYRHVRRVALPVSERAGRSAVFLPMHAEMEEADVERICAVIRRLDS
ncbi:MAG: DegT/DnrJ/EryC1/StrS family aminotransferase [Deltaproteobacteria bacterium]|nr:DegT/DnrJ/EryC1/StrS family aminotransferase [Deltaproteobacteria bacterium]